MTTARAQLDHQLRMWKAHSFDSTFINLSEATRDAANLTTLIEARRDPEYSLRWQASDFSYIIDLSADMRVHVAMQGRRSSVETGSFPYCGDMGFCDPSGNGELRTARKDRVSSTSRIKSVRFGSFIRLPSSTDR